MRLCAERPPAAFATSARWARHLHEKIVLNRQRRLDAVFHASLSVSFCRSESAHLPVLPIGPRTDLREFVAHALEEILDDLIDVVDEILDDLGLSTFPMSSTSSDEY